MMNVFESGDPWNSCSTCIQREPTIQPHQKLIWEVTEVGDEEDELEDSQSKERRRGTETEREE